MRRIGIAALFLIVATFVAAQERPCLDNTQTLSDCSNSIVKSTLTAIVEEKKAENAKKELEDVAKEATGVPTIDSFLGNSTRDFLSIFAAGLQMANVSEEQDALTFDWNLRLHQFGDNPVKLQAVLRKPVLWKDFKEHLDANVNRTKLEDRLEDFDDLTVSVTYAPEDQNFGRNLAPHLGLFDSIHAGFVASDAAIMLGLQADIALQRVIQSENLPANATFNDVPENRREEVRQLTIASANAIAAGRDSFDREIAARGVNRFSDLLNNQPQIYFSASRRERSSLVGPRETSIKATYEKGFVNIKSFRKKAGDQCSTGDDDACAAFFTKYVNSPEIIAGLDVANRFAFSLEYSDSEEYTITDTLVTTPFDVKGSRVTNGSIAYGRMVHRDRANARDGRFDLSVTYADVRGDADKDNRFIASAIYTQKINDTMSFPIGVVWSNRDAHVPNSDRRLSAHFGLVFKMPKVLP